jgi:hypothetical protein
LHRCEDEDELLLPTLSLKKRETNMTATEEVKMNKGNRERERRADEGS